MTRFKRLLDIDNIDLSKSYSVPEVAQALSFNKEYLRRLIRAGRINAYCPNGHEYRITGKEVQRIVEYRQNEGRFPAVEETYVLDLSTVNVIRPTQEQLELIRRQFPSVDWDRVG